MNAMNFAKRAYTAQNTLVRSERSIEFETFAKITRKLQTAFTISNASTKLHPVAQRKAMIEAVEYNRKLWLTLSTDVASDDNKLPAELRASILSLADFVNTQSRKALRSASELKALIDINASVMKGLRAREQHR